MNQICSSAGFLFVRFIEVFIFYTSQHVIIHSKMFVIEYTHSLIIHILCNTQLAKVDVSVQPQWPM